MKERWNERESSRMEARRESARKRGVNLKIKTRAREKEKGKEVGRAYKAFEDQSFVGGARSEDHEPTALLHIPHPFALIPKR